MNLFELLQSNTVEWRNKNYPSDKYQAIAEIFNYNRQGGELLYLREPQFHTFGRNGLLCSISLNF